MTVDTNNLHNVFEQLNKLSSILILAVPKFCVGKCLAEQVRYQKKKTPHRN